MLGSWYRVSIAAAVIFSCAGAGAVLAQPSPVSYGDWRADAPGVAHKITAAELPSPYATRSDVNSPELGTRPPGALPRVPDGFAASLWASGLRTPRVLRRAPNGDIFLAESGANRVRVFRPAAGGNAPPVVTTFADDLSLPFGIAFWPPADPRFVYVANTDSVVRFPYRTGDATARGPAEVAVPRLPTGGHWTRDLAVSADGAHIFLSIGSRSNYGAGLPAEPPDGIAAWQAAHGLGALWGPEVERADVLTLDPANNVLRTYATGLRNCVGLAVQPGSGMPWCATNERDGLGDNLPPDFATSVVQGAFYGWPWFYIGAHPETRLPTRPNLAAKVTVPDVLIQPHSAPLGIVFYDGDSFPAAYRGDAFVTLHGSWNRATRTGYKVVRLRFRDGKPTGGYDDFLTGFVLSDTRVWGRPVGVAVMRDGSLLVSEDGNGTIWRVAYKQ